MSTVTVRPSGHSFQVEPGETVLEAALRQGIGLAYGCKNGACGTCRGKLVEGELVHRKHSSSALSVADEALGCALFCSSYPRGDIVIEARELTGFGDIPIRKMPARIAKIERPTSDVAVISLQLPANERLQFRAGQYLDFILKDGARRQYSMANAPHSGGMIELHVRHTPGGVFTDRLFGVLEPPVKERDILRIEAPLGTFFLREESTRPIVLLAGGTGFAPIKAIAEHVFYQRINRDESEKPARGVHLYWGARTKRDLYMGHVPEQWAKEEPNFRYVPVLSEPRVEDAWTGRTGFVHQGVIDDLSDLSSFDVYVCGAPAMIDAAKRDFIGQCGLPEDQFFSDAFTTQADLVNA